MHNHPSHNYIKRESSNLRPICHDRDKTFFTIQTNSLYLAIHPVCDSTMSWNAIAKILQRDMKMSHFIVATKSIGFAIRKMRNLDFKSSFKATGKEATKRSYY